MSVFVVAMMASAMRTSGTTSSSPTVSVIITTKLGRRTVSHLYTESLSLLRIIESWLRLHIIKKEFKYDLSRPLSGASPTLQIMQTIDRNTGYHVQSRLSHKWVRRMPIGNEGYRSSYHLPNRTVRG